MTESCLIRKLNAVKKTGAAGDTTPPEARKRHLETTSKQPIYTLNKGAIDCSEH
jgi:hypothetical protein